MGKIEIEGNKPKVGMICDGRLHVADVNGQWFKTPYTVTGGPLRLEDIAKAEYHCDVIMYCDPAPPAWRDISTAPRDGTKIRVKGDHGPYGVTSWTGTAVWGLPTNWHRCDATWLTADADGAVLQLAGYSPTHWMPLPKPPEEKK